MVEKKAKKIKKAKVVTRKSWAWRPTVIKSSVVKKLEEAFKMDCTDGEACAYAGISRVTYYKWLKRDKEFAYKMKTAKRWALIRCRKTVMDSVDKWNWQAGLKIIGKRDERYKDKDTDTNDEEKEDVSIDRINEALSTK